MCDTSPDVVGANTGPGVIRHDNIALGTSENTHVGSFGPLKASGGLRGQTKHTMVGLKAIHGVMEQGWKRLTRPEVIHHDNITLGISQKHSYGLIWASGGLWRPLKAKPNRQ